MSLQDHVFSRQDRTKTDIVAIISDPAPSIDIDGPWNEGDTDYWESEVVEGETGTSCGTR